VFLKMIGSIVIILASSFLGLFLSNECKKRPQQLRELQSLLGMFENQITYLSDVLSEAFERVHKFSGSEVGEFFGRTVANLKDGSGMNAPEAWDAAVRSSAGATAQSGEDVEILLSFGKMLGGSDIDGQVKNIRLTVKQLNMQEEKAECSRIKNEGMYKHMGILCGAAIVILLM